MDTTKVKNGKGIYVIKCLRNQKVYVGKSLDMHVRINKHIRTLNANDHHNIKLQNAFNKYGNESFIAYTVEEVKDSDSLSERELFWAHAMNAYEKGFNIAPIIKNDEKWTPSDEDIENSEAYTLSREDVVEICELLNNNLTQQEIADRFCVSRTTIHSIRRGRTWSYVSEGILKERNSPCRKILTEENVFEICEFLNNGLTQQEIADRFGVSRGLIYDILHGKSWRHVSKKILKERTTIPCRKTLTEEKVVEICFLLNDGFTIAEISERFGVSAGAISNIRRGESWKDVSEKYLIREQLRTQGKRSEPSKHSVALDEQKVIEICKLLNQNESISKIALKIGTTKEEVEKISKMESWQYITWKHLDL